MKIPFTYYLHDDSESWYEAVDNALVGFDDTKREQIRELASRPFYELTLDCVLDTETGEVTYEEKQ